MIRVTISGADESVHPAYLVELGTDFPGVEWGILSSKKRAGTPRYPGREWMSTMRGMFSAARHSSVALHLCGQDARDLMDGTRAEWLRNVSPFRRVQINGWQSSARHGLVGVQRHCELILQCTSADRLPALALDAMTLGNTSILFDPSGGRGVSTTEWPEPPVGVRMGYAGGIGPDNVTAVLEALGDRPGAWIDMESGVRTDDKFDIGKVLKVLEQVNAFNERSGQ